MKHKSLSFLRFASPEIEIQFGKNLRRRPDRRFKDIYMCEICQVVCPQLVNVQFILTPLPVLGFN